MPQERKAQMMTKRMYMAQPISGDAPATAVLSVFGDRRAAVDAAVRIIEHDRQRMNADGKAAVRDWLESSVDRGITVSAYWHDGRNGHWRFAVVRPVDVEVA
jgi:hypothetical protein